jgi:hypothetical protein
MFAFACAITLGAVSVKATDNNNVISNGTSVTHTKESFKDFPINDTNKCNGHDVTGEGTFTTEETRKTSPTRTEFRFRATQHGKVFWTLDPSERYQYFALDEIYERSSTPYFETVTEVRRHIVRNGPHRHGNRDCNDDHGKGHRPVGDSWFFYERIKTSPYGTETEKFKDECR